MNQKKFQKTPLALCISSLVMTGAFAHQAAAEEKKAVKLDEIVVTAQKRESSLQDTPIAITAMGGEQLEQQGINSLDNFGSGTIPTLHVQPFPNSPSTLIMTIRGIGPADAGQVTKETGVGIYVDEVYLGRSQGLSMELAELERVEVLRGPQGTLFGRNAVGGAVSFTAKKPTGELGGSQTFSSGEDDFAKSITHLNLPEIAGIKGKVSYMHAQKDGWVKYEGAETDYNEYEKKGTRVALNWESDDLEIDYTFDQASAEHAQNYHQIWSESLSGFFGSHFGGPEDGRQSKARSAIAGDLEPTDTDTEGHTFKVTWDISDTLEFKSITAYRELDEDTNNNYGGSLYFISPDFVGDDTLGAGGLIAPAVIDQEQYSQEFQLIGKHDNVDWVLGAYYYKEDAREDLAGNFWTHLAFGGAATFDPTFTPTAFTLAMPFTPTTFLGFPGPVDLATLQGVTDPSRLTKSVTESKALFAEATLHLLDDHLDLTLGGRYTDDEKEASRRQNGGAPVEPTPQPDSEHFSPRVIANWNWSDDLSTYVSFSDAYKGAGVNLRSGSFAKYDEETVETVEIGLKSQFWDDRIRFNAAWFHSDYEDMQIDFTIPEDITVSETINAANAIDIDGAEFDLTVLVTERLTMGLSYAYLDPDVPLQPNTTGAVTIASAAPLERFVLPQVPQHAGSLFVDYDISLSCATLIAHFDMSSTDGYFYGPKNFSRQDSYTILNARLTATDIAFEGGNLKFAIWAKNLADEEYVSYSIESSYTVSETYGDPRMAGFDVAYEF